MGAPQNVIDDASEMEQNLTMVAIGASSTEGQVPVLNVHKYTHDVKHINHYRSIAEYSVLGVFAIVGLVFFSLVVCGNRCGACTSLLLGMLTLGGRGVGDDQFKSLIFLSSTFRCNHLGPGRHGDWSLLCRCSG